MHCQQANELFSDYIERRLDPAMTVSVDNHFAACPSCHEEMSALRRIWTTLDAAPVVEPPARLHAGIMDALDAHLEAERQSALPRAKTAGWNLRDLRDLFRPRTLAYAATALVLALSSVELVQSQRAALGPLGMAARILHLSSSSSDTLTLPAITATHSEWQADPSGGTLVVELRTEAAKAMVLEPLTYKAELLSNSAQANASARAGIQGRFDAAGFSTLRMPIPDGLSGSRVRIALSFRSADSRMTAQQEIIVPIQQK